MSGWWWIEDALLNRVRRSPSDGARAGVTYVAVDASVVGAREGLGQHSPKNNLCLPTGSRRGLRRTSVDNHLRAGSNAISNVGVGGDAGIVSPSRIARSDPGGGWAGLPAAAAGTCAAVRRSHALDTNTESGRFQNDASSTPLLT